METPGPALSLPDAGGPEANADHRTSSSRMNLRATTPPKLLCAPGKFLGLSEPLSWSLLRHISSIQLGAGKLCTPVKDRNPRA